MGTRLPCIMMHEYIKKKLPQGTLTSLILLPSQHSLLAVQNESDNLVSKPSLAPVQWRSYTRAHTGPGPGEFLSALVNHARSTYLNRNSVAVYIELYHVE